jgi:hypothetical protein
VAAIAVAWPCSSEVIDEMFSDDPASTRAAITRDNLACLYDL